VDQGHLEQVTRRVNAAASANAQGENVRKADIIGEHSNLLRDASWRHVPCASMYNNWVLGASETRRSSGLRLASSLAFLEGHPVKTSLARLDVLTTSVFTFLCVLCGRRTSTRRSSRGVL
jgi:hypothetical protein